MADDVASGVKSVWEVEEIPDTDHLYMRIHRMWTDQKTREPIPGAFRIRKGETGMSVDWAKYSTLEESRQRAKKPDDNAIVEMRVGAVRELSNQEVQHSPILENRSHTEITGEKTTEIRLLFLRRCRMVLPLAS